MLLPYGDCCDYDDFVMRADGVIFIPFIFSVIQAMIEVIYLARRQTIHLTPFYRMKQSLL